MHFVSELHEVDWLIIYLLKHVIKHHK